MRKKKEKKKMNNLILEFITVFLGGLLVGSILTTILLMNVLKEGEGFLGHFIHHHGEDLPDNNFHDEEDC